MSEPSDDRHHCAVGVNAIHERPTLVCTCGFHVLLPLYITPEELWFLEQRHRLAAYQHEHAVPLIADKESHGPEHVA
jgi:hypothetical protein